jgi:prevent-host-death family protein
MEHKTINSREFRATLPELAGRVAYGGERIIMTRRTVPLVAMVSIEDLELLESIEDREDVKAARKALREKGESVPLEDARRRLNLRKGK